METFCPDFGTYEREIRADARFSEFYEILSECNAKFNLTAVTEERDVFYKHFLDSVAGESLIPQGTLVAEVGSGAGFPSIPLMLLRNDLHFVLFESTGKKCEFLKTAVWRLGLGARTVCMRAEDAGRSREFREGFDFCVARGVARLNTLSEYCLPLVRTGGVFLAYKGRAREEAEEAEHAVAMLGGEMKLYPYSLPEGYGERTFVYIEKIRRTPEKYPRGNGKERREPLV